MFFFSRRLAFFALGLAIDPLLLRLDLLLTRDRLLWALAGSSVRVGPLTANRQRPPMPHPLVGADLDLPLDVLSYLSAEIALDLVALVDELADLHDLFLREIA